MLLPGAIVVAVQESSLLAVTFPVLLSVILVSSAVQAVAAGGTAALVASRARRRWRVIPLPLVVAVWVIIGIVRGLVGGAVASAMAGADPCDAQRVAAWILVSVVGMPLFVYTAAQLEHRRALLTERSALRERVARESARARLSARELRDSIVAAVGESIRPVIEEIRITLESLSGPSEIDSFALIGDRLTSVSADAERLLDVSGDGDSAALPSTRSPILAALAVELRRPARTALLSGVAIVPAVLPVSLTPSGLDGTVDGVVGVAVFVVVLFSTVLLRRILVRRRGFALRLSAVASYVVAGGCASLTIILLESGRLDPTEFVMALLFPAGALASAGLVTLAVGVGYANDQLVAELQAEQVRVTTVRRQSAERDAIVRAQLTVLMHGPVQGRLSACVMALRFHLGSAMAQDAARTAATRDAVAAHLAAASRDLETLSELSSRSLVQS
jgi:hypothetical protein